MAKTKTTTKTYSIERSLGRGDWEGMFSVQARSKKEALVLAKQRLAGGSYGRGKIRAAENPRTIPRNKWVPAKIMVTSGGKIKAKISRRAK